MGGQYSPKKMEWACGTMGSVAIKNMKSKFKFSIKWIWTFEFYFLFSIKGIPLPQPIPISTPASAHPRIGRNSLTASLVSSDLFLMFGSNVPNSNSEPRFDSGSFLAPIEGLLGHFTLCLMLDAWCSILDVWCLMPDAGSLTLDALTLGAWCLVRAW